MPISLKGSERRKARVRKAIKARAYGRPRLSVHRSDKNIYAQIIDDASGRTLASASSLDKDIKGKSNGGSAEVSAGEEAETAMNTFGGGRGTEIVWLVWSKSKLDDLESVRSSAFATRGKADEKASTTLSGFFEKHKAAIAPAAKDPANPQMKITGKGDIVINKIELEHQ